MSGFLFKFDLLVWLLLSLLSLFSYSKTLNFVRLRVLMQVSIWLVTIPPGLTPGPLFFSVEIPAPRTAFQCKTPAPGRTNETKIPTPGQNLPTSNAKRSMEKEHNYIKAVSFQIFHNCPFDNFFFRKNKVFASICTTLKINAVWTLKTVRKSWSLWKAKVFLSDYADMCHTHLSRVFPQTKRAAVSRF